MGEGRDARNDWGQVTRILRLELLRLGKQRTAKSKLLILTLAHPLRMWGKKRMNKDKKMGNGTEWTEEDGNDFSGWWYGSRTELTRRGE